MLFIAHITPSPAKFRRGFSAGVVDTYLCREMKKPRLILYQRISPGLVAYHYWYGDLVANLKFRAQVIVDISSTVSLGQSSPAYPPEDLSIVGECIVHPHTIIPAERTAPVKRFCGNCLTAGRTPGWCIC